MGSVLYVSTIAGVLLALMALSFFFSMSETALIALSKIKLRHMLAKGVKGAQAVQRLLNKMDKIIAAILLGNNFLNMTISAITTLIFVRWLGPRFGLIAATIVSVSVVVVFCEIVPKILATKRTERVAILVAPIMEVILKVFNPVIELFTKVSNSVFHLMRIQTPKRSPLITEEEFRLLIEVGKEEGVLSEEERKLLHRIFEFGDIKIQDVMIPKEKIISVDITATADQVLDIFAEEGHARLPVYSGSPDNIVGVIYARDLLYILRDKGLFILKDLVQRVYFVSPETRVTDVLRKFQAERIQIAIVTGESKSAVGMVTLEDLIEEIVGEIEECHTKDGCEFP
jgi:CBS domain containing-hemolysin-like protein